MKFSHIRFPLRVAVFACALALLLTGCRLPSLPNTDTDDTTELLTLPSDSSGEPTGTDSTTEPIDPGVPADTSLPAVSITTEDRLPITSRTRYKTAVLSITGAEYAHHNITVTTEIRGRGNSSFDGKAEQDDYASKNSYRLKLTQKANLLGVGETADRDWVLIANKFDISSLRNYLVWDLAERMGTIPYVPSCTWVNLYINGAYRGMYMLCEKIEVASDRVDIDESPYTDPARVGYLVEYDLRGAYDAGAKEGLTYFYIPGLDETFAWVIRSEVYNPEVTDAIRQHLIACNEAILSGDRTRMEALVDMDSFVDMFILQELSKNPDAGCSSFYMQRDAGGKLFLTAPWDFDFAFGTYSVSQTTSGLVSEGEMPTPHPWFQFLITQPWFMSLVLERMEEIGPLLTETLQEMERMKDILEPAADLNHELWSVYGEKFSIYPADQVSVKLKSYEEHVDFLINWTEERWMRLQHEVQVRTK